MKEEHPIVKILSKVRDSRRYNKTYPLEEILFLVMSALFSENDDWEEISEFGKDNLLWLREYYPYKNGIPSPYTLNRVMGIIKPKEIAKCLEEIALSGLSVKGKVLQIDGKTLRGSATSLEKQTPKEKGGKRAKHLLNVWCAEAGICITQQEVGEKANEITGFEELIESLEIEGCTITIDAMFCHPKLLTKITKKQAKYIVPVKKNNKMLLSEISKNFEERRELLESSSQKGKGHGREEERICTVLESSVLSKEILAQWPQLKTIVEIKSFRKTAYKENRFKRYYISSVEESAEKMAALVRNHWSIENHLHRVLDVVFGEDSSAKRAKNAATNMSAIRKMAVNFFRKTKDIHKSKTKRIRRKCLLDKDLRTEMLDSFFNNLLL